jgi:hypothetical protein
MAGKDADRPWLKLPAFGNLLSPAVGWAGSLNPAELRFFAILPSSLRMAPENPQDF